MNCNVNDVAHIARWLGNGTDCTCQHQMNEVNTNDDTLTTSSAKCYGIDFNGYM